MNAIVDLREMALLIAGSCDIIPDFLTNGILWVHVLEFHTADCVYSLDMIDQGIAYLIQLQILVIDRDAPDRLQSGPKWDQRIELLKQPMA